MPTSNFLQPQCVTVIPADHLIAVDGQILVFDFIAPANLHALHWDGKIIAVESINPDGQMDNTSYSSSAYEAQVASFVSLWKAEKKRREAEANAPPLPLTLEQKVTHLAQERYTAEQEGTVWRDYTIQTDDRSQAKYLAELVAIDQGVRIDPSPWKLNDSFVTLSDDDIKAMAIAARAHVVACFAAEAAVQPLLDGLGDCEAVQTAFRTALYRLKAA